MSRTRAAGEGTISKRSDGRWEGKITIPGGGKRRRKCVYGKTRQEVVAKLGEARAELARGLQPANEKRTLQAFLAEWLESVRPPNTRPATFRRYEEIVRLHLVPTLGGTRLVRLTPADVERMLNAIVRSAGSDPDRRRRKHRTASHVRAVLRTALNRARRHGLVATNAAADATWRQPPRSDVRFLTPEQAKTLLAAIAGDPLEPLITVAATQGARQGELLALRWSDIDFEAKTISIRYALQKGELVETKTDRSRRTVHMTALAEAALRRQKARQAEQRLLAGARWRDQDFVFTTGIGTPHDGTNVTKRFQALLSDAGLPRFRFHDLRHTAATIRLARGVPARVVMEELGHSQIALTLNTYSHVIPALMRDAADEVDRALGSTL